jgi:hypothetical protein
MRFVLPRTSCYEQSQYKEDLFRGSRVPGYLCQSEPSPWVLRTEIACVERDSTVTGTHQTFVRRSLNRMRVTPPSSANISAGGGGASAGNFITDNTLKLKFDTAVSRISVCVSGGCVQVAVALKRGFRNPKTECSVPYGFPTCHTWVAKYLSCKHFFSLFATIYCFNEVRFHIVTWRLKAGIVEPQPDVRCWTTDGNHPKKYITQKETKMWREKKFVWKGKGFAFTDRHNKPLCLIVVSLYISNLKHCCKNNRNNTVWIFPWIRIT